MCTKESGLRKMNSGASFLVAPINTYYDKKMQEALGSNKDQVKKKLDDHLQYFQKIEDRKCRGLSDELIAEKKKHRPPEVRRIEGMLNTIVANNQGGKVHGREVRKPHSTVVQRIQKQSPYNPAMKRRKSNQGVLIVPEHEQEEIREQTKSMLRQSGSIGGNKSLFVNSKANMSTISHFGQDSTHPPKFDPNTSIYKTLKHHQYATKAPEARTSVMKSSHSIQRLDREFSPLKKDNRVKGGRTQKSPEPVEAPDPPIHRSMAKKEAELASREDLMKVTMPTYDDGMTVEEFIAKLAADTDSEDEEKLWIEENEKLPGTCKSQYAMKFKLDTDQAIENFIMQQKKEVVKSTTKGRFPSAF